MTDIKRGNIIRQFREKVGARARLRGEIENAKVNLDPKVIATRAVDKGLDRAEIVAQQISGKAAKAGPFLGIIGLGTLAIVARRPILDMTKKIWAERFKSKVDDIDWEAHHG